MDSNKKLTTNFKWGEFWSGDKKLGAKSIEPPEGYYWSILIMAEALQKVRDIINNKIIIRSGYRTPEWNKYIDGAKNSYHMKGKAVDSYADGVSIGSYIYYLVRYTNFNGFGVYKNFVHSDMREKFTIFKI